MAVGTNAINASLYDSLNFNFGPDIVPVASIALTASVMIIHPSIPVRTVPEFVAYAKANPDKISVASSGIGSLTHISGELFKIDGRDQHAACASSHQRLSRSAERASARPI